MEHNKALEGGTMKGIAFLVVAAATLAGSDGRKWLGRLVRGSMSHNWFRKCVSLARVAKGCRSTLYFSTSFCGASWVSPNNCAKQLRLHHLGCVK